LTFASLPFTRPGQPHDAANTCQWAPKCILLTQADRLIKGVNVAVKIVR